MGKTIAIRDDYEGAVNDQDSCRRKSSARNIDAPSVKAVRARLKEFDQGARDSRGRERKSGQAKRNPTTRDQALCNRSEIVSEQNPVRWRSRAERETLRNSLLGTRAYSFENPTVMLRGYQSIS